MSIENATPRPWVVSDHMDDVPATHLRIWSPQGKSIEDWPEVAVCYADDDLPIQEMEANAELIVRAVNVFDDLFKALQGVRDVSRTSALGWEFHLTPEEAAFIDATLQRARGES